LLAGVERPGEWLRYELLVPLICCCSFGIKLALRLGALLTLLDFNSHLALGKLLRTRLESISGALSCLSFIAGLTADQYHRCSGAEQ